MFVKEMHFLNRKKGRGVCVRVGVESGAPDSCLPALTAAKQSPEPGGWGAEDVGGG